MLRAALLLIVSAHDVAHARRERDKPAETVLGELEIVSYHACLPAGCPRDAHAMGRSHAPALSGASSSSPTGKAHSADRQQGLSGWLSEGGELEDAGQERSMKCS
jgi:hypothetical protein